MKESSHDGFTDQRFRRKQVGHLSRVLGIFEAAGVNVRGYSASDTGEYGIVRFVVDKPDVALEALRPKDAPAR